MAAFYYLVSSLPMLFPGEAPLMSAEEFMLTCTDFLSVIEMDKLRALSLIPPEDYTEFTNPATVDWYDWETCFRNALVHLRGKEKGTEIEKFLREERDFFSEIEKGVVEAFNKSTPLEMEDTLDKLRWDKLNDMEVGHMFDFEKLCIYKLKLMLCEKQTLLNKTKGSDNFDMIVEHIYKQHPASPLQVEA
jgi:uncharacterized protein DUF2764